MKIVIVSGGFDPLHSGHIGYFKSAKSFGDRLIVALNSDDWLIKKKKKFFMPFAERKIIIESLMVVDEVIDFIDDELGSCINALEKIKKLNPRAQIIFCNGGDRKHENIPEASVKGVNFKFGVGGSSKKNSSSWILKNYKYDSEERLWGKFYDLYHDPYIKLKELIIDPKKGLSFQRHFHRSEIWFVSFGSCTVNYSEDNASDHKTIILKTNDSFHVTKKMWHQIINTSPNEPCRIIEIQYGEKTQENDIERLRLYDEAIQSD